MKTASCLARAAAFIAVFAAGLWCFAPWDEFGVMAFEEIRAAAAGRGYYVTCGGVGREGLFPPKYSFHDLDVEGPMARAAFREATLTLRPLRCAISLKAAFELAFEGASVAYIPRNGFEMSRGEMYAETDGRTVELKNISVEGALALKGGLALNIADKTITRSDAVMTVPPEMNMILNAPMMARYVEQLSPGEWRIKAGGR
jgi:hypothetical protein